ncbi:DUF2141 domain-containing protein [Stenotrophomonas lactitubi]|uniref:DUF2141 domain-containing protein n=1 Tax=Stenotrophomonas lactitubi TaxID=2045214 RepID=UPI00203FB30C|nr:DUF2141 domain-containing protein [Stenotrophomonas lactitubi]
MIRTSTIRTILLCATLAGLSLAASANAAELAVNVHDIRAQTGTLRVALVNTSVAWDGKAAPVQAQQARPQGDSTHFTFKDLPAGDYAVLLTHDENDNGTLDTNLVGMPVEGYGFSNNPQVMRKPTFDEARFSVPATGTTIDISLR